MSGGLYNAAVQAIAKKILVADITADGNGAGVDISKYEGFGQFVAEIKNIAGTTPTLALKLQHSDDDAAADPYADVTGGAFAAATDASNLEQALLLNLSSLKKYVRVAEDIGGTSSPRFFAAVVLFGFHKDRTQKDA